MNAWTRSLVVVAVAGHIVLPFADASAKSGGPSGAAAGHGGPAGHGANGVTGVANGHFGVVGVYGGRNGLTGRDGVNGFNGQIGFEGRSPAPPAPAPNGGDPPVPVFPPPFGDFSAAAGGCGDLQLPDVSSWYNPIDGVEAISQQTQSFLSSCGCDKQSCVADALDTYANALEQIDTPPPAPYDAAPLPPHRLPRALRALPKIVHEAAARVRAAKTPHAAQAAVQAAIEVVQKTVAKTISLMRAADDDAQSPATRGGDLVAATLKSAGDALARADTL